MKSWKLFCLFYLFHPTCVDVLSELLTETVERCGDRGQQERDGE